MREYKHFRGLYPAKRRGLDKSGLLTLTRHGATFCPDFKYRIVDEGCTSPGSVSALRALMS